MFADEWGILLSVEGQHKLVPDGTRYLRIRKDVCGMKLPVKEKKENVNQLKILSIRLNLSMSIKMSLSGAVSPEKQDIHECDLH